MGREEGEDRVLILSYNYLKYMYTFLSFLLLVTDNSGQWQVSLAIITLIAGAAAVIFEAIRTWNNRFDQCADKINKEDNEMAQLSSAVQLRYYIHRHYFFFFSHSKEAISIICAALKHRKAGRLQKTLGDSLSYIRHANGLDLQDTNLHFINIKPKNRIKYELTGKKRFNSRSIDLRSADLFRSDLSESTVCNVNFNKTVFYDTLLYGTSFHNCSFRGAIFYESDLRGVNFYACDLNGANFDGAKRLSEAYVSTKEKAEKAPKEPLLQYLDKDGIYGQKNDEIIYADNGRNMMVFLSKLGSMDIQKNLERIAIQKDFEKNYDISFDSIERNEYRDSGQLNMIQDTMSNCSGVVVLAFAHMKVLSGEIRKPKEDQMETLSNAFCPSPWMQIETAFARSLGLPCLIVSDDDGLLRNGIFDEAVVQNDPSMFFVKFSNGGFSEDDREIIKEWVRAVEANKN